ncbi:unnamed protein product [Rotaria sp. Silwood2]|nr:unnamed protein product [Rotaria sp. Silwood2]CAF4386378.1 unnamed protein product [Rotaria sp. Silwood2]
MLDDSSVDSKVTLPSAPNVTWQHIWSFSETQDALSDSLFVAIPNEILLRIFQVLSVGDLCNVSLVCRSFKMIADQDEIWKSKCNNSNRERKSSNRQMMMFCCPCRAIKLSVNIDDTARELIKLLEKASKFQAQWQQSSILKQMIIRYYRFMQLKASHPTNLLLIPTLDIEIVWQTHLLRPEIYQADCIRLFRRVIDHKLLSNEIEEFFKEQAVRDTCQLYEQRFGEKYCLLSSIDERNQFGSNVSHYSFNSSRPDKTYYSYWDKTDFEFSCCSPKDYENPFSFTEGDIILDMNWLDMCQKFMTDTLKKVSVTNYYRNQLIRFNLGQGAMKRLKKSYERFLYMAAKYPLKDRNGFVPPTYAIDIMWHSHMQEPLNYAADCLRLVGYVIFHDPWPIIEDNNMKKSCDKIDDIWKEEFDNDITTDHLYNTVDQVVDWSDEDT